MSKERFQNHFGVSLNYSHYKLTDLNVTCQSSDPRTAIFTGRIVSIGNTSNTQFINALESWVRTQPTLPIRRDKVVVDRYCPVYHVPASAEFCTVPEIDRTNNSETKSDEDSDDDATIVVVVVTSVVLLIVIVLGVILLFVCGRKKIHAR